MARKSRARATRSTTVRKKSVPKISASDTNAKTRVHNNAFVISGQIRNSQGSPLPGLAIHAFDQDLRKRQKLGEDRTNQTGHYHIAYGQDQFCKAEKGSADLLIVICDADNNTLDESQILFNAPAEATIDHVIVQAAKSKAEYDIVLNAIGPLLIGQGERGQDLSINELTDKDITFLSQDSGIPSEQIIAFINAFKMSESIRRENSGVYLKSRVKSISIPASSLYGWFRQAVPMDMGEVLARSSQTLTGLLREAVSKKIIPANVIEHLSDIEEALEALKIQKRLTSPSTDLPTPLGQLLAALPSPLRLTDDQQADVARLLEKDPYDLGKLGDELLNAGMGRSQADGVLRTISLARLTMGNAPLVAVLHVGQEDNPDPTLGDLAGYSREQWEEIVNAVGAPSQIGLEKDDAHKIYINQLMRNVEIKMPSRFIAARIGDGRIQLAEDVKGPVLQFFDNNPNFRFGDDSVVAGFAATDGFDFSDISGEFIPLVRNILMRLERIKKISPTLEDAEHMLKAGYRSARQVIHKKREIFVNKMSRALPGGRAAADKIYDNAIGMVETATGVLLARSPIFNRNSLKVIMPGEEVSDTVSMSGTTTTALRSMMASQPATATLSTLFGNQDYCECQSCASMYSPAAYLVELFQLLEGELRSGGKTALDVLLEKRPDLAEIELTCDNSEIVLPYVDLVLELIESRLAQEAIFNRIPRGRRDANGNIIDWGFDAELDQGRVPPELHEYLRIEGIDLGGDILTEAVPSPGDKRWLLRGGGWRLHLYGFGKPAALKLDIFPQSKAGTIGTEAFPRSYVYRAYSQLNVLRFPLTLPFDLPREEVAAWLGRLGINRREVVDAYAGQSQWDSLEAACEVLGIGEAERPLFREPSTTPHLDWGFSNLRVPDPSDNTSIMDWYRILRKVAVFRQRAAVTHRELLQLLETQFIQGAPGLGGRLLLSGDECDSEAMFLGDNPAQGLLAESSLRRFFLFLRLWRKLKWSFHDLDRAVRARGNPTESAGIVNPPSSSSEEVFTTDFLVYLANVIRVKELTSLSVESIVNLYRGKLDTLQYVDHSGSQPRNVPSLYERLFYDPVIARPRAQGFELNITRDDLQPLSQGAQFPRLRVSDYAVEIAAALSSGLKDVLALLPKAIVSIAPINVGLQGGINAKDGDWVDLQHVETKQIELIVGRPTDATSRFRITTQELGADGAIVDVGNPITIAIGNNDWRRVIASYTGNARYVRTKAERLSGAGSLWVATRFLVSSALVEDVMSLATLTQIVGHLAISRALRISSVDYVTLSQLSGLNALEHPRRTLELASAYENAKELGLGMADLDYFLRHRFKTATEQEQLELQIATVLSRFRESLQIEDASLATTGGNAVDMLKKFLAEAGWPDLLVELVLGQDYLAKTFPTTYRASLDSLHPAVELVLPRGLTYDSAEGRLQWEASPKSSRSDLSTAKNILLASSEYNNLSQDQKTKLDRAFAELEVSTAKTRQDLDVAQYRLNSVAQSIELPTYIAPYPAVGDVATSSPPASAIVIPKQWAGVFWYEPKIGAFAFKGPMIASWREALSMLSNTPTGSLFRQSVQELFDSAEMHSEQGDNRLLASSLQPPESGLYTAEQLLSETQSLEDRCLRLLHRTTPYIREQRAMRIIEDIISNVFSIDSEQGKTLVKWFRFTSNGVLKPLIARNRQDSCLMLPDYASSDLAVRVERVAFPLQFDAIGRIAKLARIVSKSTLSSKQIPWLFQQWRPSQGGMPALFDFAQLPQAALAGPSPFWPQWVSFLNLISVRKSLITGGLLDLVALNEIIKRGIDEVRKTRDIAQVLNVAATDLGILLADLKIHSSDLLLEPEKLKQVVQCLSLMRRTGADAATLGGWRLLVTTQEAATKARQLARAYVGEMQWPAASRPILDSLRIRRRDALTDYWVFRTEVRDANDLYGKLLLDPLMGPCMMTSRIRQAISSTQLFIQRVVMGLESEVNPDVITKSHWAWMENYRVWEANRKVLLYPENWLEPELRSDKTPIFSEIEARLTEGDLTERVSILAIDPYLAGMEELSRLEVISTNRHVNQDETAIVHVIGKTRSDPRQYYYRSFSELSNNAFYLDGKWKAWSRIGLEFGSDPIPFVMNDRLFIFWLVFEEKAADIGQHQISGPPRKPKTLWNIKLAWSTLENGVWEAKREVPFLKTEAFETDSLNSTNNLPRFEEYSLVPKGGAEGSVLLFLYGYQLKDGVSLNRVLSEVLEFDGVTARSVTPSKPPDESIRPQLLYPPPQGNDGLSYIRRLEAIHKINPQSSFNEIEDPFVPNAPSRRLMFSVSPQLPPSYIWEAADLPAIVAFPVDEGIYRFRAPSPTALFGNQRVEPAPFFISTNRSECYFAHSYYQLIRKQTGHFLIQQQEIPRVRITPFFHPQVSRLRKMAAQGNIDQVFIYGSILESEWPERRRSDSFRQFVPNVNLVPKDTWPDFELEFSANGVFSQYNWELWLHLPLYTATQLAKNQRFRAAQRWFHYIFDPTDTSSGLAPQRFWRFRPFKEQGQGIPIRELIRRLADSTDHSKEKADLLATIAEWRKNPFDPHVVARLRPQAHMYSVVMKYLDNLIAWGDQLFRRDTMESVNEATQLYILAAQILGHEPESIPRRTRPAAKAYSDLRAELNEPEGALGNPLVDAENVVAVSGSGHGGLVGAIPPTLYFCVPNNPKLLEYYTTVRDRLFKIRNCMNFDGIVRQLPLFESPIDPGLLIRARAAGIDLSDVLADANAPMPLYRFATMAQKASELCAEVRALGGGLLSAMEKSDGETLARLRSEQELKVLADVRRVKELQIEEARCNIDSLGPALESAQNRLIHYVSLVSQLENLTIPTGPAGPTIQSIAKAGIETLSTTLSIVQAITVPINPIGAAASEVLKQALARAGQAINETLPEPNGSTTKVPMISAEKKQLEELKAARDLQNKAMDHRLVAQLLAKIPDITLGSQGVSSPVVIAQLGGSLLSSVANFQALMAEAQAGEHSYRANMHSILSGYQRRAAEWIQQAQGAQHEIEQISKQIIAAGLRAAIAAQDLRAHERHVENAREVDELLRSKFTNKELHGWMVQQLSRVYFKSYQLAYDVAKRTERAFRHELGVQSSNFVQFGYWDSLKEGLLAGEKLGHDLKRMEVTYLEQNRREYEITKHISVLQLDPLALMMLRESGRCEFSVPEAFFDMDYPGHYMRRLKSLSVTIPCVVGPFSNVPCTVTLLNSQIRHTSSQGRGYARDSENDDSRFTDLFGAIQSVVTSSGQSDSGMFETNLRDERYLPFEGAGAISTWRLDLPINFKMFDYNSISDVVLHVRYTAREGGEELKSAAVSALQKAINSILTSENGQGVTRLFSLRNEFPTEWYQLLKAVTDNKGDVEQKLNFSVERFPFYLRDKLAAEMVKAKRLHVLAIPLVKEIDQLSFYLAPSDQADDADDSMFKITVKPSGQYGAVSYGLKDYMEDQTSQKLGEWTLRMSKDVFDKLKDNEGKLLIRDLLVCFELEIGA